MLRDQIESNKEKRCNRLHWKKKIGYKKSKEEKKDVHFCFEKHNFNYRKFSVRPMRNAFGFSFVHIIQIVYIIEVYPMKNLLDYLMAKLQSE